MTALQYLVLVVAIVLTLLPPAVMLWTFYCRPTRLIDLTTKRLAALICLSVFGVSIAEVYYATVLPRPWRWIRWTELVMILVTLIVSARRIRIWHICNYNASDGWDLAELQQVAEFAYRQLGNNLVIEKSDNDHMQFAVTSPGAQEALVSRIVRVEGGSASLLAQMVEWARLLSSTTVGWSGDPDHPWRVSFQHRGDATFVTVW